MSIHLLRRRQHPLAQYARAGIQGFSVCGLSVPLEDDLATEDPSLATCEKCLDVVTREVEHALVEGGKTHLSFKYVWDRTVALCGFQRANGRYGRITMQLNEVTCPTCRAIGEADR